LELHQLSELEQQMSDDLHWAWAAPEVQQHAGRYVAIHKKRVVGVGLDARALAEQAAEKEGCHWGHIVITAVPEPLLETSPDFVDR
jgi:hypothetical protein